MKSPHLLLKEAYVWGREISQTTQLVVYRVLDAWQRLSWYFASDDLYSLAPIIRTELALARPSNIDIGQAIESFQSDQIERAEVQAYVMSVLRSWKADSKELAIVSNGDDILQRRKMEQAGLCAVIPPSHVYITSPQSADAKPRPGLINRALEEIGADSRNAIVIGDRSTDIIAGKLAHCGTVQFVGRGPEVKLPPPAGMLVIEAPDAYAVDWRQVAAAVKSLLAVD